MVRSVTPVNNLDMLIRVAFEKTLTLTDTDSLNCTFDSLKMQIPEFHLEGF